MQPKVTINKDTALMRGKYDNKSLNRNIVIGQPLAANAIVCGWLLPGFSDGPFGDTDDTIESWGEETAASRGFGHHKDSYECYVSLLIWITDKICYSPYRF